MGSDPYSVSGYKDIRSWAFRGYPSTADAPLRIKTKITPEDVSNILVLRKNRKLGHRSIVSEMKRLHGRSFSTATIQKILEQHNCKYLKLKRGYRKRTNRYSRPIPGDRVQMDVCKIGPGFYQYTAIDDCSRFKVLALYPRRTAVNTLRFLELVLEQMPFPIQRIQTDRGNEFFAENFQKTLMAYGIKFRPVKPRSPHLNGKVERSQRTDLDEFYSTVDLKDPDLNNLLSQWQFHYNWFRAHSSLNGKAPIDVINSLSDKTPFWDEVGEMYDESKERFRVQNYRLDLQLNGVKRCL